MGFFKIRNITSLLSKRDAKFNSTLPISMKSSQFKKEKVSLAPDAEFAMEANFLPIELHKLRSEGFVSILEISKDEFLAIQSNDLKTKSVSQVADHKQIVQPEEKKVHSVKKREYTTTTTTAEK